MKHKPLIITGSILYAVSLVATFIVSNWFRIQGGIPSEALLEEARGILWIADLGSILVLLAVALILAGYVLWMRKKFTGWPLITMSLFGALIASRLLVIVVLANQLGWLARPMTIISILSLLGLLFSGIMQLVKKERPMLGVAAVIIGWLFVIAVLFALFMIRRAYSG